MVHEYKRISLRPLGGAIGAEILGVDLARLDDETFTEIEHAFHEHIVLQFHDQDLTPEEQISFTRRFGPVSRVPYVKHLDEYPDIVAVRREPDEVDVSPFGNVWHADFTFLEEPPLGSVLYAREAPETGGDTLFSNMYRAYETLSTGLRRVLDGLNAMHSGRPYGAAEPPDTAFSRSMAITRGDPGADRERPHPVVRVHPVTKRRALFVNSIYTLRFEGMTRLESRGLLRYLYEHASAPDFTCRIRWKKNDVAVWDNRCSHHYAINDYGGQRRLMHRTTMKGERPIPVRGRRSATPESVRGSVSLRDSYAPPLLAFLRELGTAEVPHTRRTLLAHLVGTASVLEDWGARDDLCRAGLFHSIYATESFDAAVLSLRDRARVQHKLGEQVERLVYVFCRLERRSLFQSLAKGEPFGVDLLEGGGRLPLSTAEMGDLVLLYWANALEQRAEFTLTPGTLERSRRAIEVSRAFLPPGVYEKLRAAYA